MKLTVDEFMELHQLTAEPKKGILVCGCGLWRSNAAVDTFSKHLVVEAYKQ